MAIKTTEHKFVEQRKIMRLVCYKSHKEGKPIKSVCPFGNSEIKEMCKNCMWFKVVDESTKIKTYFKENEIEEGRPITLKIGDLKGMPISEDNLKEWGNRPNE